MISNNLLSVKQVAFILKVHPLTIRRYINDQKLKAIKAGGNVRIEEIELQNFNREITPKNPGENRIFKLKAQGAKQFGPDDPLFHLMGRGASLKLS